MKSLKPDLAVACDMLHQARRFFWASQELAHKRLPIEAVRELAYPSLFNSFVSSELFLKLLNYRHSGQMMNGHNLLILFNNLAGHHRAKIRKEWREMNRLVPPLPLPPNPAIKLPSTLEEELEAAASSYETFRYRWESQPHEVFTLHQFPAALERVTLDLYPDLQS